MHEFTQELIVPPTNVTCSSSSFHAVAIQMVQFFFRTLWPHHLEKRTLCLSVTRSMAPSTCVRLLLPLDSRVSAQRVVACGFHPGFGSGTKCRFYLPVLSRGRPPPDKTAKKNNWTPGVKGADASKVPDTSWEKNALHYSFFMKKSFIPEH